MRPPVRVPLVLILILAGSFAASQEAKATKSPVPMGERAAAPGEAEAAVAPPGELDTTFGTGGKSLIDLDGQDFAEAVALQPDGKIIVAGGRGKGDYNFMVARLLVPQGTLDPTYGLGTGWSNIDFGGGDIGRAVTLQPDGKIIVAGESNAGGTLDFAVARLLVPQGTFDLSFGGGDGRALTDLGSREEGAAVALQPDGKIVVAGSREEQPIGLSNLAVARLLPEGTLDLSYGGGSGWSNVNFGRHDYGRAVALQPDGKIVVAGYSNAGGTSDFAVARLLNPEGTLDTSFGLGTGKSLIDLGLAELAEAVVLQPDGKIVVAGYSNANGTYDFAVARLQPNGVLDTTFGTEGKSIVDVGDDDGIRAVALQPDGKIVVAGYSNADGTYDFAVARLQPNGLPDTTFGTGGKSIVDFGGTDDPGYALALQPDGKIVVAGRSNAKGTDDVAVARLEGDPGGPIRGPGGGPPICAGKPATIIGTQEADILAGTPEKDVIVGLGGKDKIRAGGALDIVCAGSGNDTVAGQGGKDQLRGEKGKDRLLGGPGADRLFGGPGRDRLIGGPGKDRLRGGPGLDSVRQ